MGLDLVDYERKAREAVMAFWGNKAEAAKKRRELRGIAAEGNRDSVRAGKNMDGFVALVHDLAVANGLPHLTIHRKRGQLVLPGFYRSNKEWDMLVFDQKRLIAAFELKSHVGSFGNNLERFHVRCSVYPQST